MINFTKIKEILRMKRHHLDQKKPVITFTASLVAATIGIAAISSYTGSMARNDDFNDNDIIAVEENTLESPSDATEPTVVTTSKAITTKGTTKTTTEETTKAKTTSTAASTVVTTVTTTATETHVAVKPQPKPITSTTTTTVEPTTVEETTTNDSVETTTEPETTTSKVSEETPITSTTVAETTPPATTTAKKTEWVVYKPSTHYIHRNTCHWFNDECYEITSTEGLECRKCTECNPDMDIITPYSEPAPVSNGYNSLNYITEEERIYLCNTVGTEYGSDWVPIYDKACVVATVMNRVHDGGWTNGLPSTVYNVLTAPHQYDPAYAVPYYRSNVTQSCIEAVEYYFSHQGDFPHYTSFWGDGRYNYFR